MSIVPIITGNVVHVDGLEDYIQVDYSRMEVGLCPYCNGMLYTVNVHEKYCRNCDIDWASEPQETLFEKLRKNYERAK